MRCATGDFAMNERRIEEIYRRSLEMNCDAFADGEYDLAYQVLLVALHCGQRLRNIGYLIEVERLAEKESTYVNDHHPEYKYSDKVAIARGGMGVFQMAAQQAKTIIHKIVQANGNGPAAEAQSLLTRQPGIHKN
jgi:hypothetical protein